MDKLIRIWRVEIALFICYCYAWRRGDQDTIRYCLKHGVLVNLVWGVIALSPLIWVIVTRFIQYGWR